MFVYFSGLVLGLSLVTALGPQNVFLIRQGVLRQYAILSAAVCFICDVILVSASVAGLHELLTLHPALKAWVTWGGVLFLAYYGFGALKNAVKPLPSKFTANETPKRLSHFQIILLSLGFSLLNPHAIIDTLIIIGGSSGQFPGHQPAFLMGVITSSFLWLTLLTCITQCFAKVLTRQTIWRRFEFASGILMVLLSLKLAFTQLH